MRWKVEPSASDIYFRYHGCETIHAIIVSKDNINYRYIGISRYRVVTGLYNAVVDLSDACELREEDNWGRLKEYSAGVLPNTANTIRGPHAWMSIRTGLDGLAISTPEALCGGVRSMSQG
jgi:hypothetical protein